MFRAFQPSRAKGRKGLISAVAMALALATGAAVGMAGFAETAHAQPKPKYSKPFVAAYEPVANAYNAVPEGGDLAAVKTMLAGMLGAVENADDRFAAGQLVLQIGNKATDGVLQRQGLELMLASGKVAAEQVGQFQFFVGNLAYQQKDFAAARTALEAALASGYTENDPQGLIIESYFQQNADTEGLAYLTKTIRERQAAGRQVPDNWMMRGLQVAFDAKLVPQANELALLLVKSSPTPNNWLAALQVVRELNQPNIEEAVDLGRLMLITGAMQHDYDLAEYLEAADPRKLSNEVLAALDAAQAAGVITAGSDRFKVMRDVAQARAAADRAEAPTLKGEAQSAATGSVALGVADTFLSFGGFADAEAMYQLALDKGGVDANRVLTRLGIAQLRQGKVAEAEATFGKVQGTREQLAKMWSAYAATKGATGG